MSLTSQMIFLKIQEAAMNSHYTYDELKKYWHTYSGSIDQFVRDAKAGQFGTSENKYSYGRIEALKNMKIVLPREDV